MDNLEIPGVPDEAEVADYCKKTRHSGGGSGVYEPAKNVIYILEVYKFAKTEQ